MKDILIRDVPDAVLQVLDDFATHAGQSRQEFILALLADAVAGHDPGLVVGYWEVFGGEMTGSDCSDCGQPMTRVFVGMTRGYRLIGPVCEHCANTA
jgi:hypothetical protein